MTGAQASHGTGADAGGGDRPVRIGAVSYLNTRPLVHGLRGGLGGGRVQLEFGVPSALARRLAAGEVDVALLPTVELARIGGLTVVVGLGIAARGDVGSVMLVARRPLEEVRSVALDPESRTSNALARVLFAERWKTKPSFEEVTGPLEEVLARYDAAIRIGDKALSDAIPEGAVAHDLAGVWAEWTGLPFVFAVWAGRAEALAGERGRAVAELLRESYRAGRAGLEAIVEEYAAQSELGADAIRRYLSEHIRYEVGVEEMAGMRRFFEAALRCGVAERIPDLRLVECEGRADGRGERGER